MRLALVVIVAATPLGACSDAFVTSPPPVAPPVVAQPTVAPPPPTIVIRGATTLGGQGLFIIDGVVVGPSGINRADIEEIEVIKGAAAAPLYGEMRCPPIIIRTIARSTAPSVDR